MLGARLLHRACTVLRPATVTVLRPRVAAPRVCRAPRSSAQLHTRRLISRRAASVAPDDATAADELRLYNTLSRQKEVFTPRAEQGNKVSMYVCGVTVYDYRCVAPRSAAHAPVQAVLAPEPKR